MVSEVLRRLRPKGGSSGSGNNGGGSGVNDNNSPKIDLL